MELQQQAQAALPAWVPPAPWLQPVGGIVAGLMPLLVGLLLLSHLGRAQRLVRRLRRGR